MAAFASEAPALEKEDIKVVAFSVDDEPATVDFVAKNGIAFPVGHSADIE